MKNLWKMMIGCLLSLSLFGCPNPGLPEAPRGEGETLGRVFFEGNIFDGSKSSFASLQHLGAARSAKSFDKEVNSLRDISIALLDEIDKLSFEFNRQLVNGYGNYSDVSYVDVASDGYWSGSIALPPGTYLVYARAMTKNGLVIYTDSATVNVEAGLNTSVSIVFEVVLRFNFYWHINDLPGLYPNGGLNAFILAPKPDGSWRQYWVSSYGECCSEEPQEGSKINFYANLPVNFNGIDAVLFVQDIEGNVWAVSLSDYFDIFSAVNGEIELDYVPSENVGTVSVSTEFDHDRYVYAVEVNEYFETLQDVVNQGFSEVHVELGPGSYAGFVALPYKSAYISGQGLDTMIGSGVTTGSSTVIHVRDYYRKGGGSPVETVLSLDNLVVSNGPGGSNNSPKDAAILFEALYGTLKMDNVLIHNASNSCVTVTNNASVDIDHCIFVTWWNRGNGVTILGQPAILPVVKNSIFDSVNVALEVTEPEIEFTYNCVNNFNALYGCTDPTWELPTETLVLADPLFVPGSAWVLDLASPCIGAGDDGLDLGLLHD